MAIEQRTYQGNLIQRLVRIVDELQKEHRFILQDARGCTFGVSILMSQHEADFRNINLAKHQSTDYRWSIIPEGRGK